MKKLILMVALLVGSLSMFAETHTVARGETLQSIAEKYNLTTKQLVEANPGAEKLFYVGLKLTIPESVAPSNAAVNNQSSSATYAPSTAQQVETHSYQPETANDDAPGAEFAGIIEWGFLPKTGGSTNLAYTATVGVNYYFMHKNTGLFAGARIGYSSATLNLHESERGSYYDLTRSSHFISIPLNVGYALTTSNKNFGITPYAGLDLNFCVAAKDKEKKHTSGSSTEETFKLGKKVGIDARVGVQLRLGGFNVGGSYVMPLNDNQEMYFGDDSYFAINIGWGF
ncbi:MAG: outer membrane beta-barrel protein [Muribaculaceae bacterium]|nr:outer membrane beta-barrel protein [Muribaculaceae bacterium]